ASDIEVRSRREAVIEAAGEAKALALVAVVAQVDLGEGVGGATVREVHDSGYRFDVVDRAPVVVVGPAQDEPERLVGAEAVRDRHAAESGPAAALQRVVSALQPCGQVQLVARGAVHEVDGASDRIALAVCRDGLVELDRSEEVGGEAVELDLPDTR